MSLTLESHNAKDQNRCRELFLLVFWSVSEKYSLNLLAISSSVTIDFSFNNLIDLCGLRFSMCFFSVRNVCSTLLKQV